jgi:hypothetical protein
MSGIIASFVSLRLHKTVLVALHALAVITILWSIQKAIAPSSTFFFDLDRLEREIMWTKDWDAVPPQLKVKHLLVDPVAPFGITSFVIPAKSYDAPWGKWPAYDLPAVVVYDNERAEGGSLVQLPIKRTIYIIMCVLWLGLLGLGIYQLAYDSLSKPFHRAVLICLLGQFSLHFVYGIHETFMYSPHWTPLLIIAAAATSTGRYRYACFTVCAIVTLYCMISNPWLHSECMRLLDSFSSYAY